MKTILSVFFGFFISISASQTLLKPDRIFDGNQIQEGWVVLVEDNKITAVGPESNIIIPENSEEIILKNMTLLPGLIEGHSHILLHPYNETNWNDQVLKESPTERSIRATKHVNNSLLAGVTTMRDLGSEGAGYSDVYIKKCINEGIIIGPRLLVAGPAIVATGAYGPKGFHDGVNVPLGAEEASGDDVIKTVRRQLGNGADFIKIYADYRWQPQAPSQPTFTIKEIKLMVEVAESAGSYVVAHASTTEGMRRAILGGVETIEHGDQGTAEIFNLMKVNNVGFCPTIAAGDAVLQYNGWEKGKDPEPIQIKQKRESFKLALESGVDIVFGGDVGVFTHGENYRELELMVQYGMTPIKVLQSATSLNASIFHLDNLGQLKAGFLADIIAVEGDPTKTIESMRKVTFVMKNGIIYKK